MQGSANAASTSERTRRARSMPRVCVLFVAVLVAGPAAGFVVPPLAPRTVGGLLAPAGSQACARWTAGRAPRCRRAGLGAVGLRSQQQVEDTVSDAREGEGGRQGTAKLFDGGAPFPPPWLLPFLVPATGGALFGYDIGATSAVTRILGENAGSLGQLGAGEIGMYVVPIKPL